MTGIEARKIIEERIAHARSLATSENFQKLSEIRQSLNKQSEDIIWSFKRSWGHYADEILKKKSERVEARAQSFYGDCSFNYEKKKRKDEFIKENMLLFGDEETISDEDLAILNGFSKLKSDSVSRRDDDYAGFNAFKAQADSYISFASSIKAARDDLELCEQILKQRIYHIVLEISPGQIEGYKTKAQEKIDKLNTRINSGDFKDQNEFTTISKKITELRKQIALLDSYLQKIVGASPTNNIEEKAKLAQEILDILGVVLPKDGAPVLSKETVGQAVSTLQDQISNITKDTKSTEEKMEQERENIRKQNLTYDDYHDKSYNLKTDSSTASNLINILKEADQSNNRYAVPLRVQAINASLNIIDLEIAGLEYQLKSVDITSLLGRFNKSNKEKAAGINGKIQKLEQEANGLKRERTQKDPNNNYEQRIKEEQQRMSENQMFNNTSMADTNSTSKFMDITDAKNLKDYIYSRGSSPLSLQTTSISNLITRIGNRKRVIDSELESLEKSQTSINNSITNVHTLETQVSQNKMDLNERNQNLAYLQSLTPQGIDALNTASEQMELINSLNSAPITPEEEEAAKKQIESDIEESFKKL